MATVGDPLASLRAATIDPPCSAEPERWFDRAHRTYALAECLKCPVRGWCAQEALRTRASWGMWAGIWLDGTRDDESARLRVLAAHSTTAVHLDSETRSVATEYATPSRTPPPLAPTRPVRPGSVTTAVLARSSGHCEIVADYCRFVADTHMSRLPVGSADWVPSAAALYAACNACCQVVRTATPSEARRRGYLVDSPAQLAKVPFHWRAARWVFFGQWGELHETSGERIACAS